jgi:hypothetical protein
VNDQEKKETSKDMTVGGVAAAAGLGALALAHAPVTLLGAAALLVPTVVAAGYNHIAHRDRRRAEHLVEWMISFDDQPDSFAKELDRRIAAANEDTLGAFRVLVLGAVEAVSPDAIAPLGFIGRRFLRGECAQWIARGIVDVLSKLDSAELRTLRQFVIEIDGIGTDWVMADAGLYGWTAKQGDAGNQRKISEFRDARRLFGLLKRAGLGTEAGTYGVSGSPQMIELDQRALSVLRETLVATISPTT